MKVNRSLQIKFFFPKKNGVICDKIYTQKNIKILHIYFFPKNILFLNSLSRKLQTDLIKFVAFVVLGNE